MTSPSMPVASSLPRRWQNLKDMGIPELVLPLRIAQSSATLGTAEPWARVAGVGVAVAAVPSPRSCCARPAEQWGYAALSRPGVPSGVRWA